MIDCGKSSVWLHLPLWRSPLLLPPLPSSFSPSTLFFSFLTCFIPPLWNFHRRISYEMIGAFNLFWVYKKLKFIYQDRLVQDEGVLCVQYSVIPLGLTRMIITIILSPLFNLILFSLFLSSCFPSSFLSPCHLLHNSESWYLPACLSLDCLSLSVCPYSESCCSYQDLLLLTIHSSLLYGLS